MAENKYLNVEIINPQNKIFNGNAVSVNVPGSQSPFQILYNHAPIVSALDAGVIKVVDDSSNSHFYAINSGFLELNHNNLSILVDSAISANDIDKGFIESQLKELNETKISATGAEKEIIEKKIRYAEAQLKAVQM